MTATRKAEIMICGRKNYRMYIVEFKTADGEALATSGGIIEAVRRE